MYFSSTIWTVNDSVFWHVISWHIVCQILPIKPTYIYKISTKKLPSLTVHPVFPIHFTIFCHSKKEEEKKTVASFSMKIYIIASRKKNHNLIFLVLIIKNK